LEIAFPIAEKRNTASPTSQHHPLLGYQVSLFEGTGAVRDLNTTAPIARGWRWRCLDKPSKGKTREVVGLWILMRDYKRPLEFHTDRPTLLPRRIFGSIGTRVNVTLPSVEYTHAVSTQ
jgi:hypothetical protein